MRIQPGEKKRGKREKRKHHAADTPRYRRPLSADLHRLFVQMRYRFAISLTKKRGKGEGGGKKRKKGGKEEKGGRSRPAYYPG